MKMHDKNGCDSQRFKIKKIMAMNLLLLMCSWSNAETYLSDHKLAEQQSDAKHMDTQSIQRVQKSIQQPIEQQKQESKALSNQNSQEIQQQTIDETVLSDYQMQKKKAAELLHLNEKQDLTYSTVRLFDIVNQADSSRLNNFEGISIEMKP